VQVTIAGTDHPPATLLSATARKIPLATGVEDTALHLNRPPASRKSKMTSNTSDVSTENTMGGVMSAATQNATHAGEIARASSQVVAKRVALGMVAALNPLQADYVEFARRIPEKVEAFTAAGMVMMKQSGQAGRQFICLASDEVMTTARATIEMAGCSNPATLAEAQRRFAGAWFSPGCL
jgi:hypothetical protein